MKDSKKRLKVSKFGMVNAIHRGGDLWVVTSVPVEFAKQMLEEKENIERSDGYIGVGDSWGFEIEEFTE